MNFYILIPSIISIFFMIPPLIQSLIYYFKHRLLPTLVYSVFILIALLAVGLFGMNGLLIEGQELLANISLAGSLVLLLVSEFVLGLYIQLIYGKFKYISYAFFAISIIAFTLSTFQPWQIIYIDGHGYSQPISPGLIIVMFLLVLTIFLMLVISVKKTYLKSKDILQKMSNNEDSEFRVTTQLTEKIEKKNRMGKWITIFYGMGMLTGSLGLIPNFFYLDILGAMITFIPISFFIVRHPDTLSANPTQIYGTFIVNSSGLNCVEYTPLINFDSSLVSGGISTLRDFIDNICKSHIDVSIQKNTVEIIQFSQIQVVILTQKVENTLVRMFTFVNQTNFTLTLQLKRLLKMFIKTYQKELIKTSCALPIFADFKKIIQKHLEIYEIQ